MNMRSSYEEANNSVPLKRAGIVPYPMRYGYMLALGERSDLVTILQLMINALRLYYDLPYIALNGEYDEITLNAVKLFQKFNKLKVTGVVDNETWDRLTEEYNLTVNDNQ